MEDHGGNLTLDDRPGGGAAVSWYFNDGHGAGRSPARALRTRFSSRLMAHDILIVDDEADIRL